MNDSLKILESYVEIDKLHDEISNKLFNFINKANELVEASSDDYQLEKTLLLNKISLKSYILDSECCNELKKNNIENYTIDELKNYLKQFSESYADDYYRYFLAVSLYEIIEEIEKLTKDKIELEIKEISILAPSINNIKNINQEEYEKLYLNIKSQLENLNKENKLEEKSYNICIQLLNEIFNFYISGYPTIPDDYLYHDEEN